MIGTKRMRSNSSPAARETPAARDWRSAILADPSQVLADGELMNTLLGVPSGTNITDLNVAARQRLQSEITLLQAANEDLLDRLRGNLAAQASAHAAVMGLMDEPSLAALDRRLAGHTATTLGLEAVRVCLEGITALPRAIAILPAAPGLKTAMLGEASERLGPPDPRLSGPIYGVQAGRVASEAVIALEGRGFSGVLCLGSARRDAFRPDDAADLAHFLARILERRLESLLG